LYAFECKPCGLSLTEPESSIHRSGQHPTLTKIKAPSRATG
jgi:hypothetical protein